MSRSLEHARETLVKGGDLVELAEAIGAIISDPSSSLDDIRLGLRHGGLIAEQATIALHRREGTSTPPGAFSTVILSTDEIRNAPNKTSERPAQTSKQQ